jgi:hypothetical protein
MAKQTNLIAYFGKRTHSPPSNDVNPIQKRAKTTGSPTASVTINDNVDEKFSHTSSKDKSSNLSSLCVATNGREIAKIINISQTQSVLSPVSSSCYPVTTATAKLPNATTQPFKHRSIWVCPYKSIGKCSHSQGHFPTFMGLAQHVRLVHSSENLVTTYDECQMHDGTQKIPCPNGCGVMSATHQQANQHAKLTGCTAPPRTNLDCPWRPYNGCSHVLLTAKSLANHSRSHASDSRSPYQCKMEGCGIFHADLYQLAMHEERCKGNLTGERRTSTRYCLTASAEASVPPSVIIVIRSSAERPNIWKAGTDSFEEGLPLLGQKILAHYAAWSSFPGGSAVLHSCYDCPTRYLPASAVDDSFLETTNARRSDRYRAFKFTQAIVNDIEAANQAGIKPILLSVGVDGWACDRRMILPWLQGSTLRFDLVLRLNGLNYGMTDRFVELHHNVYWATYNPEYILEALEFRSQDDKYKELVTVWNTIQDGKDVSFGVKMGRNAVNLKASFPPVL